MVKHTQTIRRLTILWGWRLKSYLFHAWYPQKGLAYLKLRLKGVCSNIYDIFVDTPTRVKILKF